MCCLFGILDYENRFSGKEKSRILSVLAKASEARGIDASGIAYWNQGKLVIKKQPVPGHLLRIHVPDDVRIVIGHTRMTTQGSARRNYNNHPFQGNLGKQKFALAHNGILYNDTWLRKHYHFPHTRIETDSYAAVQLLEQQKRLNLESLQYMAEQLEGSYTFTILGSPEKLYIIRGDNPLCIYHDPRNNLSLYASTEEILRTAWRQIPFLSDSPETIPLSCGEILELRTNGKPIRKEFDTSRLEKIRWTGSLIWEPLDYPFHRMKDPYLRDLMDLANQYGCSAHEIWDLLQQGFTIEDLEEYLYEKDQQSLIY